MNLTVLLLERSVHVLDFFLRSVFRVTRSKHVGGAGRPRICNKRVGGFGAFARLSVSRGDAVSVTVSVTLTDVRGTIVSE